MKKILLAALMLFSSVVNASEVIQIIWPFGAGANHAVIIRELTEQANKNQSKYKFVFVVKQGAGGTIAANYVLDTPNTLFANSSSFFITPAMIEGQYDIDKFSMVGEFCSNRPVGLFSKNFKDINKDTEVTVGVVPGTVFDLTATLLINNGYKIVRVPFKSGPESQLAVMGGHVQYDINFLGGPTNDRQLIGVTGRKPIDTAKTFATLGAKGLENVVIDLFLFAPSSMGQDKLKELHQIFNAAHSSKSTALCEQDFGKVTKTEFAEMDTRFRQNKKTWSEFFSTNKK